MIKNKRNKCIFRNCAFVVQLHQIAPFHKSLKVPKRKNLTTGRVNQEMRAQKLGLLLAVAILVFSTLISSFASAYAPNPENTSSSPVINGRNANAKLKVSSHRITAAELQALKEEFGVSDENKNYNQLVDGHGTGLRAPTADEWQALSENLQITETVSYQSSTSTVDNSALPWFPPIGNQDGEGSCVAWSVGYYIKTFQEAKEHGWDLSSAAWIGGYSGAPTASYQNRIMSPDFVYHLINNGVDNGASYDEAINLVCAIGISSWQKMPYNRLDHTTWPSEAAWTEAALYRGNSSGPQHLSLGSDSGLQSLKNLIASGNLATIGVDADKYSLLTPKDVWTLDNYANPDENHANTVVGYDDNFNYTEGGQTRYGAFKIANSWGIGFTGEKISDGFLWISYQAMKQRIESCVFFYDRVDYQPEISATFKIDHSKRDECQITVGVGSATSPIITKSFTQYVDGGSVPFGSSNIVLDITEFKNYVTTLYNQSYFLKVKDVGSTTTGTITKFAVGNSNSTDVPKPTIQNTNVYLNVMYTLINPELAVTPTSGPSGGAITLNGWGFKSNSSANVSYLNPVTSNWVSIANNTAATAFGTFNYNLSAPELLQNNHAGDHSPLSDAIVFHAVDNANGLSCNSSLPYCEWRRGLTRVGAAVATGLYGNNSNLSSTVQVNGGQSLLIEGKWFKPGNVTAMWDHFSNMGSTTANATGFFNVNVTIPTALAGPHNITINDGNAKLIITLTYLPSTVDNYDGLWRNTDFNINLTSNPPDADVYYRINGGTIRNVNMNGQPRITTEGSANTLEYWSIDSFGNEEEPHKRVENIKLDKTSPAGSIQINNGASYTTFVSVALNLTFSDALSGVYRVRFSNDGLWDTEQWETPSTSKNWTLTTGDGEKTVYYQIKDNAGSTPSFSDSITFDATSPLVNAGEDKTVTAGSIIVFDASGSKDNVGIVSYLWDFGDGTNGTGMTTAHSYSDSGDYTASLVVQDAAGNVAMGSIEVTVEADMVPEFPTFFALALGMLIVFFVATLTRKARHASLQGSQRTL